MTKRSQTKKYKHIIALMTSLPHFLTVKSCYIMLVRKTLQAIIYSVVTHTKKKRPDLFILKEKILSEYTKNSKPT